MNRDATATKDRLIDAAAQIFAQKGFEATTVREIAAAAKVNPALINRYFGGKEQLFVEAVSIEIEIPNLSAVPHDQIGKALIEHFFRRWESDARDDHLKTLIRTAATQQAAAQRIRSIFSQQVEPMVCAIAGSRDAEVRANLVATQILGLAFARYVVGLKLDEQSQSKMKLMIAATIQRYLFEPLA